MEKVVSSARLKNDPVGRLLIDDLQAHAAELQLERAILYYDFPLFRDYEEELFQPAVFILHPEKGAIVVSMPDTAFDVDKSDAMLDEFHSLLYSKLLASKRLRSGRNALKLNITTILYLPQGVDVGQRESENVIVSSFEGVRSAIAEAQRDALTETEFLEARSVIEGVKALSKSGSREATVDESKPKAMVLRALEDEIANFDANQRRAALTVALGPQRIRGLAGSGKTIILAWKAAHILLTNPEKKILFTFYTRSLYETIRKQITRFYRHFRDSDPNWDNLHVLHGWGGTREPGVYYNTCVEHMIPPRTYSRTAPVTFDGICAELNQKARVEPKYDVVLVDEAQDLPESFFRLLYSLTKGVRDEKTIIWAYDELQSIFSPQMRTPRELFGVDANGEAYVDLDRSAARLGLGEYVSNDLVLYKCYRNPREVLVCSHAVGLGIYGQHIVQMLQDRGHWEDVGYVVEQGDFTTGSPTVITRPAENSPLSIPALEPREELIKLYRADSFPEELDMIVVEVMRLLEQGLKPDDILIICLDDRNAKNYHEGLTQRFAERSIGTHDVLNNPFSASTFRFEGRITLSTVHRAKGNEAPAVFVAGIDAVASGLSGRTARNRLFTAFTRTKCWLRISGLAKYAGTLFDEIETALAKAPKLEFQWPNLANVETLQRDLSQRQAKARRAREEYLRTMSDLGFSDDDAQAWTDGVSKSE
ncbi:DEAD/DEAH box helicase [Burkholderia pseudomallei]|uniref:DEAD/DEAH box helicase n=1 Tax=Burkholderia pseudomallei TaxID=28450 RepID=UPI00190D8916|nr:ATP-binding domain-containing protein [Burkholderia pseudomallei]MBK3337226.1 AAA family ATPase [Burkholderia pseudomallei]